MKLIACSDIIIPERQRKSMDPTKLNMLEATIREDGLINPILLRFDPIDETFHLVAGERRLTIIRRLEAAQVPYTHDQQEIPFGMIPYTLTSDLTLGELMRLEFQENDAREDLAWQDRMVALNAMHEQLRTENPSHSRMDTARELIDSGTIPTSARGGEPRADVIAKDIAKAQIIARNLADPTISKARNHNEAYKLAIEREARGPEAELIRRRLAETKATQQISVRHGSMFDILPKLDDQTIDLILMDPPYGIQAGNSGFRNRTVHHHNYEDTPELARQIIREMAIEGFRICKPEANIFMFGDIEHFFYFRDQFSAMGWTVWRRPIIWRKSNEGLAPWGQHGPRYTYDMIFYAKKGTRGLISSPTDVLDHKRVSRAERQYAAQKPLDLMRQLIECSTLPGDTVLDPTCGSGSTLVAAKQLNRHAIGIEVDKDAADLALIRIEQEGSADEESAEAEVEALA